MPTLDEDEEVEKTLDSEEDKEKEEEEGEKEENNIVSMSLTRLSLKMMDPTSLLIKQDWLEYINCPDPTLVDPYHWKGEVKFLKKMVRMMLNEGTT